MGTVQWKYDDWRSYETPAQQLERLKLHLQEVGQFVIESSSKARSLKLSEQLLPYLRKEQQDLESKITLSRMGARGVSRFVRGANS